ncbi:MAG: ester cyclase [Pseudomonadota bacterium]
MTNKMEVAETWYRRVWKEQDESAIDELFVPRGSAKGLGSYERLGPEEFADHEIIGPDGFKDFHRAMMNLVTDTEINVTMTMEKDDWLAQLCVFKGIRKDTGEAVQMTGTVFAKIIDGKIVEAYNHFDFLSFFEQLGSLAPDTFAFCLSGNGDC